MPADTKAHLHLPARRRLRLAIALFAIAIAAVGLAACGGSSSSGSTTTNSANTTKQSGSRSNRFASLRSCLQKEGINLPSAPSGSGGRPTGGQPGSGGPPSGGRGGFKLPEGVSRTKFEEAIKKCGGGGFPAGGRRGFNSAASKATLTKYAECMRENGVNLPTPNTSGKGPVFNTKGIDTSSETFKNAQKKCQSDLKGAFGAGRPPGGKPPAGAEGGPPAGAEGGPPAGGEGGPPPGEAQG